MDANKEKERDEARKMKEKEIKDSKDQLIFERGLLVDRLKVAEECIEQGNIELAEVTKSKVISRQKSTGSHKKINNGLKRKSELTTDIETLDKKLKVIK